MAFPSLSIGDLTAKMPIVQGGMGVGISLSGLASAVANQGGIGVIAGAMIGMKEPDVAKNPIEANLRALRQELTKAREKTQGIIGVNIMVALTTFSQMVRTAIENRADIIFSGAGLPLEMPKHLLQACEEKKEEFKTKLVPIVSSARAATLIARKWLSRFDYLPDAFVVEGPKAGGHLGFKREEINDPNFALEVLVPQVVEAAKRLEDQKGRAVPVIAAGGIYTGEDIKKFLDLGASGVQMGTRFVATKECDADDRFKQSYIAAREEDITIIKSPPGQQKALQMRLPLRAYLRPGKDALLHRPGPHQRHEGQPGTRLRLLRRQRGPGQQHRFRQGTDGIPAAGIRPDHQQGQADPAGPAEVTPASSISWGRPCRPLFLPLEDHGRHPSPGGQRHAARC